MNGGGSYATEDERRCEHIHTPPPCLHRMRRGHRRHVEFIEDRQQEKQSDCLQWCSQFRRRVHVVVAASRCVNRVRGMPGCTHQVCARRVHDGVCTTACARQREMASTCKSVKVRTMRCESVPNADGFERVRIVGDFIKEHERFLKGAIRSVEVGPPQERWKLR